MFESEQSYENSPKSFHKRLYHFLIFFGDVKKSLKLPYRVEIIVSKPLYSNGDKNIYPFKEKMLFSSYDYNEFTRFLLVV